MNAGQLLALVGLASPAAGCTLLNGGDPCEGVKGREHIVNQRAERQEGFARAPRLALLPDGTTLLAFDAQDSELTATSVRVARLAASGSSLPVCNDSLELDRDVSAPDHFAWGGIAVPVAAPNELLDSRALVAWIERLDQGPSAESRMLFQYVDGAGCPVGVGGPFDAFGRAARAGTVAWSASRRAALAVMHDDRALWAQWIGSTSSPTQLATASPDASGARILDYPGLAFAQTGEGLVAWFDTVEGFRTLLLGASGEVVRGPTSAGIDARCYDTDGVSYTVSAGSDRFALVASAAPTAGAAAMVFVREFSLDGDPLGPARRVDAEDARAQSVPNAAYLPSQTLLVTWHAAAQSGTVGRFYRPDGAARFCALGCDEKPFVLGARSGGGSGASVAASVGNDLWVAHVGRDAIGTGIYLWQAPFGDLYPAGD